MIKQTVWFALVGNVGESNVGGSKGLDCIGVPKCRGATGSVRDLSETIKGFF